MPQQYSLIGTFNTLDPFHLVPAMSPGTTVNGSPMSELSVA